MVDGSADESRHQTRMVDGPCAAAEESRHQTRMVDGSAEESRHQTRMVDGPTAADGDSSNDADKGTVKEHTGAAKTKLQELVARSVNCLDSGNLEHLQRLRLDIVDLAATDRSCTDICNQLIVTLRPS